MPRGRLGEQVAQVSIRMGVYIDRWIYKLISRKLEWVNSAVDVNSLTMHYMVYNLLWSCSSLCVSQYWIVNEGYYISTSQYRSIVLAVAWSTKRNTVVGIYLKVCNQIDKKPYKALKMLCLKLTHYYNSKNLSDCACTNWKQICDEHRMHKKICSLFVFVIKNMLKTRTSVNHAHLNCCAIRVRQIIPAPLNYSLTENIFILTNRQIVLRSE